jgi:methylated-DNA-[protein]-cysteine S-methyltransferase
MARETLEAKMTRVDKVETPIGTAYLQLEGEALVALRFDQPAFGLRAPDARDGESGVRSDAGDRLRAYLAGDMRAFEGLPLAPRGTEFQHKVWDLLREIPAGETRTYGELAARLGSHPRAVGSANGSNPICIVVPCHRVIAKGGGLCGYAWGTHRKEWLLQHEQALLLRAS